MSPYKALFFDLYGTLVDFPFADYEALIDQIASLLELPKAGFAREWKITWIEHELGLYVSTAAHIAHVCEVLGKSVSQEKIDAAASLHSAYQAQILAPKPGSIELLTELKRRGYKTAVISNCPLETKELWPTSPLSALTDVALFSTIERMRKPAPAIFALACARLQVEAQQCAMVGDSWYVDVLGAHQAGMAAYWLNPSGAPLPDEKIATSIATLSELLAHFS